MLYPPLKTLSSLQELPPTARPAAQKEYNILCSLLSSLTFINGHIHSAPCNTYRKVHFSFHCFQVKHPFLRKKHVCQKCACCSAVSCLKYLITSSFDSLCVWLDLFPMSSVHIQASKAPRTLASLDIFAENIAGCICETFVGC